MKNKNHEVSFLVWVFDRTVTGQCDISIYYGCYCVCLIDSSLHQTLNADLKEAQRRL